MFLRTLLKRALYIFLLIPFSVNAQLSGTFTIGSGGDYSTINLAVTDLETHGVNGSCTFNILDGTYSEQVSIGAISGASAADPIIFQSNSLDSTLVTIQFDATSVSNHVLEFDGTGWITFRKVSIVALSSTNGRVIDFSNSSHDITVENCILEGASVSSFNPSTAVVYSNDLTIDSLLSVSNNRILEGSYGIYFDFDNGPELESGNIFQDNIIENQFAQSVYLRKQRSPKVIRNICTGPFNGINLEECSELLEVSNNRISVTSNGISIDNCDAGSFEGLITNNFVHIAAQDEGYGISLYNALNQGVYFNSINITGNPTDISAAIYISVGGEEEGSGLANIKNNNLANNGGGYSYYVESASAVNESDHNNLYTTGSILGYWVGSNNDVSTLSEWQSVTGKDGNSISVDPFYISDTDLHTVQFALDQAGTPVAGQTIDIDGESRDAVQPDIGADEIERFNTDAGLQAVINPVMPFAAGILNLEVTLRNDGLNDLNTVTINWSVNGLVQAPIAWSQGPLSTAATDNEVVGSIDFQVDSSYSIRVWTSSPNSLADENNANDTIDVVLNPGISGVFTIGSSGDFASINEAVTVLKDGGIIGNVVFNLLTGTFSEQVSIPSILGAGSPNSIIFQSQSGNTSDVTVTHSSTHEDTNYTFQLSGVSGITIRDITIEATGGTYGRVLDVSDGCQNTRIENNSLKGVVTASSSLDFSVTYIYHNAGNNTFVNNVMEDGSCGMYLQGDYDNSETNIVIDSNQFTAQQYTAMYVSQVDGPVIRSNLVQNTKSTTGYRGMWLENIFGDALIAKNNIQGDVGHFGLGLLYSSANTQSLLVNNFIQIGGTTEVYGLYLEENYDYLIAHNTVNVTGTTTIQDNFCVFAVSGAENLVNNIFANTGGGQIYRIPDGSGGIQTDNNDLFRIGGQFAKWEGSQASNLSAWQSISGQDANSITDDPEFVSSSDLHVLSYALDRAATPLAQVTDDIDGDIRSALPDIGADEFDRPPNDVGLVELKLPTAGVTGDVRVELVNLGNDTLTNVLIEWEINSIAQDDTTWIGKLATDDTVEIILGQFNFDPGVTYNLFVEAKQPNGGIDAKLGDNTINLIGVTAPNELSGTYSIGSVNADFPSFKAAVDTMLVRGVVPPVIFSVQAGSYAEQIEITPIAGATSPQDVVFTSQTGDSTAVDLNFAGTVSNPYTLLLDGVQGVSFKNITISATASDYANVVLLTNGASDISLENCQLVGVPVNEALPEEQFFVLSNVNNSIYSNHSFKNNRIVNGSIGCHYEGSFSNLISGLLIEGNIFEEQWYTGIEITEIYDAIIEKNSITATRVWSFPFNDGFRGIDINQSEKTTIRSNTISAVDGHFGIRLNDCFGGPSSTTLVINNFVHAHSDGNVNSTGIWMDDVEYANILNNSVHLSGNHSGSRAMSLSFCQNLQSINNNLANNQIGSVLEIDDRSIDTYTSDHNNYFGSSFLVKGIANGGNGAFDVTSEFSNVSLWSANTGLDGNSLSVDPLFISDNDLHSRQFALSDAGIPQLQVTDDIDGESRDLVNPSIGADEFSRLVDDACLLSLLPILDGNSDVRIVIENKGSATLSSLSIDWTLNNVPQSQFNYVGSLATDEQDTVAIGNLSFNSSTVYSFKIWSTSPNGNTDGFPLNDTLRIDTVHTALIGVYTIGGVSPDFPTIQDAADTLAKRGIGGKVIFNIRPGTYNEQVTLGEVQHAKAKNDIIFQAENGDSSSVILEYDDQFVLEIDGTDGVTFRDMTIKGINPGTTKCIEVIGNCDNLSFQGNRMEQDLTVDGMSQLENFDFSGNRTIETSFFLLQNNNNNKRTGSIINNELIQSHISLSSFDSIAVVSNLCRRSTISINTATGYFIVSGNTILNPGGENGLSFDNYTGSTPDTSLVSNNTVFVGGVGVSRGISTSRLTAVNIYNNSVHLTNTNQNSACVWQDIQSSLTDVRFMNNILSSTGGASISSFGGNYWNQSDYNNYYLQDPLSGENLFDLNLLQNNTGQENNSVSLDPLFTNDQDLHTNQFALLNAGIALIDVAIDIDSNVRALPPTIGATKYIIRSNDAGIGVINAPSKPFPSGVHDVVVTLVNYGQNTLNSANINWSINGTQQPDVPWSGSLAPFDSIEVELGQRGFNFEEVYDISAWTDNPNGATDENVFNDSSSVKDLSPSLSGVYTVGLNNADFTTFNEVSAALSLKGIIGDVTFNIQDGTYNEKVVISPYIRSTPEDRVVFQSLSGVRDNVILTYDGQSASENYTFRVDNVQDLTLSGITLESNPSGKVVLFENSAEDVVFDNNIIRNANPSSGFNLVEFNFGSSHDSIHFTNNLFENGGKGINYFGTSDTTTYDFVVEDNIFQNQISGGFETHFLTSPTFRNNVVTTNSSITGYIAAEHRDSRGRILFEKNRIHVNGPGSGVSFNNCDGDFNSKGLVSNNFVSVDNQAVGTVFGIRLADTDSMNVFYNNIRIAGTTNTSSTGLEVVFGSTNNIVNNISANYVDGYAVEVDLGSVDTVDFNNYYTTGVNLGRFGGDIANLSAWQAALNKDTISHSVDPLYTTASDLRPQEPFLKGKGTPLSAVLDDIEGELRNATTPDIGADEFEVRNLDIGVIKIVSPEEPFEDGNRDFIVRVKNFGVQTITSANINWTVNAAPQIAAVWNGSLAPGSEVDVTLGSFDFLPGVSYTLVSWTEQPNNDVDEFFVNDSTTVDSIYPSLSGFYSIGTGTETFNSINEAFEAIESGGILGNVTLVATPDVYEEQLVFSSYEDFTNQSTVTLQSLTQEASDVKVVYNSDTTSKNYTFYLDGVTGLIVRDMTFEAVGESRGRVVELGDGSSNISFIRNTFKGRNVVEQAGNSSLIFSSSASRSENTLFKGNTFIQGSLGIDYRSTVGIGQFENNNVIDSNLFLNQNVEAISIHKQFNCLVTHNEIRTISPFSNFNGIHLDQCFGSLDVTNNYIHQISSGTGIFINKSWANSINDPSFLTNNMIQVGTNGQAFGIYLKAAGNLEILHNSVNITSTSPSAGRAFFADTSFNIKAVNNIFANTGGGYAIYNLHDKDFTSDYNDLYTTGPELGFFNTPHLDLSAWQSSTGNGTNSISSDPRFESDNDLHVREVTLDGTAFAGTNVTLDIDGEARDANFPDIGADEFFIPPNDAGIVSVDFPSFQFTEGINNVSVTIKNFGTAVLSSANIVWTVNETDTTSFAYSGGLASGNTEQVIVGSYDFRAGAVYKIDAWTEDPNGEVDPENDNDSSFVDELYPALNGNYTLGNTGQSFSSFQNAAVSLNKGGVTGPVTIDVESGVYVEVLKLQSVPGVSGINTITFRSSTGDSTSVQLISVDNTVEIIGTGNVIVEGMTIKASAGNVISLSGNSPDVRIQNNILNGTVSGSKAPDRAVLIADESNASGLHFNHNYLTKGSYGVYLLAGSNDTLKNVEIVSNTFEDQLFTGIRLSRNWEPEIRNNKIVAPVSLSSYNGIHVSSSWGAMFIIQNKVNLKKGVNGINLTNCSSVFGQEALVANNFIATSGSSVGTNALRLENVSHCDFYFNSLNIHGNNVQSTGLILINSDDCVIQNNVIANQANGYALSFTSPGSGVFSDFNDLYTTGANLGFFGSDQASLNDWKTASSLDANSISIDPMFNTNSDLHARQPQLDGGANPIASITVDIDNEFRSPAPDIGADEFSLSANDVGVVALLSPASECDFGSTEEITVRVINFGTNPQTGVVVGYTLDGGTPVTEVISTTIAPGTNLDYTFSATADLSAKRPYTFDVFTNLAIDEVATNDSLKNLDVDHFPDFVIGISDDQTSCAGENVNLAVVGGILFDWSNGESTPSIQVGPTETTVYGVEVTNDRGCVITDSVVVNTLALPIAPTIDTTGTVTICSGFPLTISTDVTENFVWSTGETTQSINVSEEDNYNVTITGANGCTNISNSVTIVLQAPAEIATLNDLKTICKDDSIDLVVQNAIAYLWSTGETTETIRVGPLDTTLYSVTATNSLGCVYNDDIQVNVIEPVSPGVVGNMLPLNGSSGVSLPLLLSWLPGSDAIDYDIYIWADTGARPEDPFFANVQAINKIVNGGLEYGQLYNWQVVSKNPCASTDGPIQQFTLRQLPDLTVTSVVAPSSAFSGDEIEITWRIRNVGNGGTLDDLWFDQIFMGDGSEFDPTVLSPLKSVSNLTALNPGESYELTSTLTLPNNISGEFFFFILTNEFSGGPLETTDTNNVLRAENGTAITLRPPPDLQVTSVIPSGTGTHFSGTSFNIQYTVSNEGSGQTVVKRWKDEIYLSTSPEFGGSQSLLGEVIYDDELLGPGESYTNNFVVTLPLGISGPYYIHVATDVRFQVYEHALDDNNTGVSNELTIILVPPADLIASNMEIPDTMSVNESGSISYRIENIGGSSVTGLFHVAAYITDSTHKIAGAHRFGDMDIDGFIPAGGFLDTNFTFKLPSVIEGHNFIFLIVDEFHEVFEFDDDNNLLISDTTVFINTPDINVTSITLQPTALSGEILEVVWESINDGPGTIFTDQVPFINEVYFSPSPTLLGTEQPIGFTSTSSITQGVSLGIEPGQTFGDTTLVQLPNGISGQYYMHVLSDVTDRVYEPEKEENNHRVVPITVSLAPAPDLRVTDVSVSGAAIAGSALSISYTVTNTGDTTAPAEWMDIIYISTSPNLGSGEVELARLDILQDLDASGSYTLPLNVQLPPNLNGGNYFIIITTDAADGVFEDQGENNNLTPSASFALSPYPSLDLLVSSINAPVTADGGDVLTIQYSVLNQSSITSAYPAWNDGIYLSNDPLLDAGDILIKQVGHNGTLGPNASYSNETDITLDDTLSGNFFLLVVADHLFRNNDLNLINNANSSPLAVTFVNPPDLEVTNFQVPVSGVAGQPVQLSWTVENVGIGTADSVHWIDQVFLSSTPDISGASSLGAAQVVAYLEPGDNYTIIREFVLPANQSGNFYVFIESNSTEILTETDESNNTASSLMTIEVPPPSDLQVLDVSLPLTALAGDSINVSWTVLNSGQNPATGVMRQAVYFSQDQVYDVNDILLTTIENNIHLAPQSTLEFEIDGVLPGLAVGDYYAIVRTDVQENIAESDENNNEAPSIFTLRAEVPELVIDSTHLAQLQLNIPLYYRLDIPDSLTGESILLTLKGDSIDGANEVYVRFGDVPTRADFDLNHNQSFSGNQQLVISNVQEGSYYIQVFTSASLVNEQEITLKATIQEFLIFSIDGDEGGNTGLVTIRLDGAKFEDSMTVSLVKSGVIIEAQSLLVTNPTTAFATFDLSGVPVNLYHVAAQKDNGELTFLRNSFNIVEGEEPSLSFAVRQPSDVRLGRTVSFIVEYFNDGNVNLVNPTALLTSEEGAPVAPTIEGLNSGLTEFVLNLLELNGPDNILRPGAGGSIVIYSRSTGSLIYSIEVPDFD